MSVSRQANRAGARRRLIQRCARLLLCLPLFVAVAATARPALWVVHRNQATVYLFGTIHLLPDHTAWRYPELTQALKASDALYLEVADDNPAHMHMLIMRYGLDLKRNLSSQLSPADNQRLQAAAKLVGGTAALQPMKPWLAALTLNIAPLLKAGMNPRMGADKQIKAQMLAAGKPVHGLETSAMQIRLLASMPQAQQWAWLRSTLRDFGKAKAQLQQLLAAWKAGDVAAIARQTDQAMRKDTPALYNTLIVRRNQRWVGVIAALLKRPGTTFIAVGAAHLAGPDGLPTLLARKGLQVQRL